MTALARVGLAALLALPAVSCAQDKTAPPSRSAADMGLRRGQLHRTQDREPNVQSPRDPHDAAPDRDANMRRLESVTWNSVKHELTWVISKGQKADNRYKANQSMNYAINMDDATMTYNSETRRFSKQEAANVHVLMDLIAKYAVDSTVWWDEGHGEPVDGTHKPASGKQSVAVLHISARPAPGAQALDRQIRNLQQKLAELKLLRATIAAPDSLRPASY